MADEKVIRVIIEGSASGSGASGKSAASQAKADAAAAIEAEKRITASHNAELKKRQIDDNRAFAAKKAQRDKNEREAKAAASRVAKAQIAEARKAATKFNQSWAGALKSYQFKFNAMGNIAANVMSKATRAFTQGVKAIVNVSKDFEEQMSAVQAVSQATGKEFDRLRQDAIRLGGSTIFTAKNVAELQLQLGKLGFTVSEVIAATEGILSLAAAAGEDLASSAAIAGGVIRAFGEDANNIKRIVDAMAKSFTSSALDLEKFRESMKFVAPVAANAGFHMEEITAVLGALSDQMVHGSLAGTSLRNILLRLSNANSKLSKAMGLNVKSLPELIVGLENLKRAGLDAAKAQDLTNIRAVTALLALAQQTDGVWKLYRSIVETTRASDEMAETRMDNFAGSVEKLTGAWESFVLAINQSNGGLRRFVDAAREQLDNITDLFKTAEDKRNESVSNWLQVQKEFSQQSIANQTKRINEEIEKEKSRFDSGKVSQADFNDFLEKKDIELTKIRKDQLLIQLKHSVTLLDKKYKAELKALETANNRETKFIEKRRLNLEAEKIATNNLITQLENEADKDELKRLIIAGSEALDNDEKIRKLRISAMQDGVDKELAQNELKWDTIIDQADEFDIVIKDTDERRESDRLEIIKKWQDKELKAIRDQNSKIDKARTDSSKFQILFGEGGEIHGAKHTSGGVPIEAEGGEYVVKADQYAKYKDLVVAINEDKVNQAWGGLNKDLQFSTDNSDMVGAMNKYWGTQVSHHNGYRVERSGNRTRKIYA
jgi:TP901 family phage tail tape measure protein